jgi:predicted DNA-binding transcriptional regulator YafY
MLRAIPRAPRKVTVHQLLEALQDRGFQPSRRTVERDLQALSMLFPLKVDDRARPYGWSWMKDGNFSFMPRLTTSQAVALLLAKTHLQRLLPRMLADELRPLFATADEELADSGWKHWHQRTAIVLTSMPLLPPRLDINVLEDVQRALVHARCLSAHYRTKGSRISREVVIHPLGLLVRGPVQYLVGTMFDYVDILRLPLHRLSATHVLSNAARIPEGFDFAAYAAQAAGRFNPRGKIRLVACFDWSAAEHLRETPLSENQTLREIEGSTQVELSATVQDDEVLRWWLLAFGGQVEVISPPSLRAFVLDELRGAIHKYERREETTCLI